jgi:threonine dehydrogenase-like Zn-dependent dehydrogenase
MQGIIFQPEFSRILMGLAYERITRKAPLFRGGPLALADLPTEGHLGPRSVRVRSHLGGICGTDLNLLHLRFSMRSANLARKRSVSQPVSLGHEVVGKVLEVGPEVRSLRVGQRVVYVPGASCISMARVPACEMCTRGLTLLCLHRDESRLELADGGGWAHQLIRDESQWLSVPDEITDEETVLIEPLACSAHAVLRRLPPKGGTVAVIGCGTIGLGVILVLRALAIPVRIIALARHRFQADQARTFGADVVLAGDLQDHYDSLARELNTEVLGSKRKNRLLQGGVDLVYDAVGSGDSLQHALRWAKPRGAVVLEGINPYPSVLDRSAIWLRELEIIGAHGHGRENALQPEQHTFELVMNWIREKRLKPGGMVTHRFSLKDHAKAIRAAEAKGNSRAIKVVFDLSHDE